MVKAWRRIIVTAAGTTNLDMDGSRGGAGRKDVGEGSTTKKGARKLSVWDRELFAFVREQHARNEANITDDTKILNKTGHALKEAKGDSDKSSDDSGDESDD